MLREGKDRKIYVSMIWLKYLQVPCSCNYNGDIWRVWCLCESGGDSVIWQSEKQKQHFKIDQTICEDQYRSSNYITVAIYDFIMFILTAMSAAIQINFVTVYKSTEPLASERDSIYVTFHP